jgi:DNA-3-methyladenine glycosylase I
VPEYDSRALWEKLQLDGMQAGLAWITILRKRETMREEFDGFDPERVARWDEARIEKALTNPGIIRSPAKVKACIGNAQAWLDAMDKGEDFSDWLWSYVDGKPLVSAYKDYRDAPTKTPVSEQLAKDLKKRGHKFCGPVIVYAFMQAVGMINDHEIGCKRHAACKALAR